MEKELKVVYVNAVAPDMWHNAGKNRVDLISRGLRGLGANVRQLYFHFNKRSDSFFAKIVRRVGYFYRECTILMACMRSDVVIIYGEVDFRFAYRLLPLLTTVVVERNEFPAYLIRPDFNEKQIRHSKEVEQSVKHAHGLVTCSNALATHFSKVNPAFCSSHVLLPLVVDVEEFGSSEPLKNQICYCGFMGGDKDGIRDLLQAFSLLDQNHYPDLKLILVGGANDETMRQHKDLAEKLGISENVLFTGWVQRSEVASYLNASRVLLLARPSNKQAEGGLPSKVCEYLATGRPVLVTDVGEISDHLHDQVDSYIVAPDDPQAFAQSLQQILDNYEDAKIVGEQGRRLAESFHYTKQAGNLLEFVKTLLKRRPSNT